MVLISGNPAQIRFLYGLAAWITVSAVITASPPLVVPTDPLPPPQQRQAFHLPEGFEIELIACEPDIGQPMNLSFDAAGRLWVTHSVEYPYPVAGEGVEQRDARFGPNGEPPPKDRVSIVSGIGTDDLQVTHYSDGLNIPIGIVPLSPTSAIGYSIPNLVKWDGKGPHQLLFGPFGNVDTHGMVNGLTHWIDGWIYACHGFRNTSTIKGSDGHEITMNSGNTFRFRPDGSRVEQVTWGQVNPYGLTFDPWGNIYTADCHSMPLTCLIPGAYYTSFGKPHDGLGFGPGMIDHSHGSTGICGPCYYAAEQFPPDFRDCIYLCNPVTGIVHRDRLVWHGSTPQVDTQPDFITCDDGWFRPVDIQLGPDGALYIADFYNAIIGHYESPLDHPKRDRTHGRIWRVTYSENSAASGGRQATDGSAIPVPPDLTQEPLNQLIDRLGDPNLTIRVLASHEIADKHADHATDLLRQACREGRSDEQRIHALWLLFRLGADLDEERAALEATGSALVKTHLARLLGQLAWNSDEQDFVTDAASLLFDDDPRVQRAAAGIWSRHPNSMPVDFLLRVLPPQETRDTHLRHTIRIALRDGLRRPGELAARTRLGTASLEIASACLGIPTEESAAYLLNALKQHAKSPFRFDWIEHIARYGSDTDVDALVSSAHALTAQDVAEQMAVLRALEAGHNPGHSRHPELVLWATDLARSLLDQAADQPEGWTSRTLPGTLQPPADWRIEVRPAEDGTQTRLWSSLPGGERGVGRYQSPSFAIPEEFSFWIAGHDGSPGTAAAEQNHVQLVRAADGHVLRSVAVPGQDLPTLVTWTFTTDIGKEARMELVDGLDLRGYAWIAAGRFSIDSLNPPAYVSSELAAELIGMFQLAELRPDVERLIVDPQSPVKVVQDLAAVHLQLMPDVRLEALLPWLESSPKSQLAARLREQLLSRDPQATSELLMEAMRTSSSGRQQALANVLAGEQSGATEFINLITAGHASPRLLQSAAVQQKLSALSDQDLQDKVSELLRHLPPENERLADLIGQRRESFDPEAASIEHGREMFKKSCAACHQIGNEGKKVGPQLDGIGVRGIDRLLEDMLDPNRNVDAAFRSTTILTNEGRVLTGLLRDESGDALVLVDSKGEEFRIASGEIDERSLSPLSLMPEELVANLPVGDLHDLLAFLLQQTQKKPQ